MKTVCVSYVILYTRVNPNFIQTDSNIQTSRRKAKFEQIHTHLHDIKRLFKAKHVSFILHGAFLQHSFTETHSSITACQSSAVKNRQRLVTSLVLSVFVCLFVYSLCNAPLRTIVTKCLIRRVTLLRMRRTEPEHKHCRHGNA